MSLYVMFCIGTWYNIANTENKEYQTHVKNKTTDKWYAKMIQQCHSKTEAICS